MNTLKVSKQCAMFSFAFKYIATLMATKMTKNITKRLIHGVI